VIGETIEEEERFFCLCKEAGVNILNQTQQQVHTQMKTLIQTVSWEFGIDCSKYAFKLRDKIRSLKEPTCGEEGSWPILYRHHQLT
jgi:hypothetical protein